MRSAFKAVKPTSGEIRELMPGDGIVPDADVVMDRAFSLDASVEDVWPWFVQLGKQRSGWYFPRSVERFIPAGRRALRSIDPALQGLAVGDVIPDWGGRDETFKVAQLEAPHLIVHTSKRGQINVSWAIQLKEAGVPEAGQPATRIHLRLRLSPVKRKWLVGTAGDFFDLLTIAGLAAGLRERVIRR